MKAFLVLFSSILFFFLINRLYFSFYHYFLSGSIVDKQYYMSQVYNIVICND